MKRKGRGSRGRRRRKIRKHKLKKRFSRRMTNYEGLCDLGGSGYFYMKRIVAEDYNYTMKGFVVFDHMGLGTDLYIREVQLMWISGRGGVLR